MAQDASQPDIAYELATRQRDISVSEFFLKNRHLLGFDSPAKALVIAVKEAVDNALDACEEAGILPEIRVEIENLSDDVCRVAVEDNGPGIVEKQLARIFGKLLYGSRFHKLSQSRGQQGLGISAAGMYAQLTTGKSLHVISRIRDEPKGTELFVTIDTARNRPELHGKKKIKWDRPHGTRVTLELEGNYHKGAHSVDLYLQQTAIANSHVTIHFRNPHGEEATYERSANELPARPVEIKPHPYGVELGRLIQMLSHTRSRTLLQFLENEFSRVGRKTAREIIHAAGKSLTERSYPKRIAHVEANALYQAIKRVPVSAPLTNCIVPIGETQLEAGLRKELDAAFYFVTTRPPQAYRGNPFQVEAGIAYGHGGAPEIELDESGHLHKTKRQPNEKASAPDVRSDEPARLIRFANRVPLLYDQGGCAITKAVTQVNWRQYGLHQTKGSLPLAPLVIVVHIASVWVPFTSEAKESIAAYPEIQTEVTLGLQKCGRALATFLRREKQLHQEFTKRTRIEKYLPHVGLALQEILALDDESRAHAEEKLDDILHETRRIR